MMKFISTPKVETTKYTLICKCFLLYSYGIPSNLYSVFTPGFTYVTSSLSTPLTLSEYLNSNKYTLSTTTALEKKFFLKVGNELILSENNQFFNFKIFSFLKSSPIFRFSLSGSNAVNPDVLVGLDTFLDICNVNKHAFNRKL